MSRLKQLRPLILMTGLITVIAVFYIFSLNEVKEEERIQSVGQVSKSIAGTGAEEERELFMAASNDPYTTSRGDYDRLAEPKPVPTEVKSETPAEAVAKPAAPVKASAKPAAPVKAAPKQESQYAGDVDVLARLIMAEAQGEPYEAKVAVGAVVINRVQSGQWANTVKSVIYQKSGGYYQFTPVQNGWINNPADPECIKAAKAALAGADPTNGAQFYYDNKVTNEWILAKPVSVQYGHMIFAY